MKQASAHKGQVSTPDNPCGSALMIWIRDVALPYEGDDCLIWPFPREANGYGSFGRQRKKLYAHRYICELANGPPPTPKHHAAHSCHNGPGGCVARKHLSWKTNAENQHDRYSVQNHRRKYKLTPEQVDEIRSLRGKEAAASTAARFEMTVGHIQRIQTGQARTGTARQFSDSEIHAIRRMAGRMSDVKIGAQYGVSPRVICRIRHGHSYSHVVAPTLVILGEQPK